MKAQQQLEEAMDKYLVKDAPFQVPESGRKALVEYLPILALIGGILTFLAAVSLWNLAHTAIHITNTLNDVARSYGVSTGVDTINYGLLFYLSFAVLIAQGALLFAAYSGLKARSKKRGWDLLLLNTAASVVYGVIYTFTDTGHFSTIVTSLIGALIGFYLLAQIKGHYKDAPAGAHRAKPAEKVATKKQ